MRRMPTLDPDYTALGSIDIGTGVESRTDGDDCASRKTNWEAPMADSTQVGAPPPSGDILSGPVTYRGSESGAHEFLDAVQSRVSAVAVRVRWLDGSAVWFDAEEAEVARVRADQPVLQELIAGWARKAETIQQGSTKTARED